MWEIAVKTVFSVLSLVLLVSSTSAQAGDVEIKSVYLEEHNGRWRAEVTLQHADAGWEHYADAWRLVGEDGKLIATRVLYHPHVNEQPFTRSLDDITLPAGKQIIYIEAHDKEHGWSKQRVKVDLTRSSGDRYHIRRK